MSFDVLGELVVRTCNTLLGSPATYSPQVGDVRTIMARVRTGEQVLLAFGNTRHRQDGATIEVMRTDLTVAPQEGDFIETEGQRYRVRSARPGEPAAVVWLLDCVPT